jgi:hypothetical protein
LVAGQNRGPRVNIVFNILLFTHLVALVVGASTNVAIPIIGARLAAAGPDARAALGGIAAQLSRNSGRALWTLIGTGLAMVAIVIWRGTVTSPSPWFIAKIAIVLILLALLVIRSLPIATRLKPSTFGLLTRVCLLSIVFCSVMAFN